MPVRGRRSRRYGRGGPSPERPPRHELPRVAAEEALAERAVPAHQVHHGTRSEALLSTAAVDCIYLSIFAFLLTAFKALGGLLTCDPFQIYALSQDGSR